MEPILELIVLFLEDMFELLSPEKTANKVKDTNTSKSTKWRLIFIFTLIYSMALIGSLFSLLFISDVMYRVFSSILITFLLYCMFIFYKNISTSK